MLTARDSLAAPTKLIFVAWRKIDLYPTSRIRFVKWFTIHPDWDLSAFLIAALFLVLLFLPLGNRLYVGLQRGCLNLPTSLQSIGAVGFTWRIGLLPMVGRLAGAAPWAKAAPETKVIANNKAAWAAVLLMLIDVLPSAAAGVSEAAASSSLCHNLQLVIRRKK
jgi:hypothetical protein